MVEFLLICFGLAICIPAWLASTAMFFAIPRVAEETATGYGLALFLTIIALVSTVSLAGIVGLGWRLGQLATC